MERVLDIVPDERSISRNFECDLFQECELVRLDEFHGLQKPRPFKIECLVSDQSAISKA